MANETKRQADFIDMLEHCRGSVLKVCLYYSKRAIKVGALKYRTHKRMPIFVELNDEVCGDIADETTIPYHDILYDLIERLSSEDDRQMLYLYLDGKSHSEIAKAFGLTTVNVRQRIHRITKKLIKLNEQDL